MIRLSKGETRGLTRLLNMTPDEGFIEMVVERRMPQADVLVTRRRRKQIRAYSGAMLNVIARDQTIIGPRGGHYTA